jgi:hypothetical protein
MNRLLISIFKRPSGADMQEKVASCSLLNERKTSPCLTFANIVFDRPVDIACVIQQNVFNYKLTCRNIHRSMKLHTIVMLVLIGLEQTSIRMQLIVFIDENRAYLNMS